MKQQTLEGFSTFTDTAPQLLLPPILWKGVSQHQKSGIYLENLLGVPLRLSIQRSPEWEGYGVKHLEVESPTFLQDPVTMEMTATSERETAAAYSL